MKNADARSQLNNLKVEESWGVGFEMRRMRFSGFTLIELLVVIAIIAVLAAILFPIFTSSALKVLWSWPMKKLCDTAMNGWPIVSALSVAGLFALSSAPLWAQAPAVIETRPVAPQAIRPDSAQAPQTIEAAPSSPLEVPFSPFGRDNRGARDNQALTPLSMPYTVWGKSMVTVPLMMERLQKGELTPQQAWQKGSLSVDDLVYILSEYVDEWGKFPEGENEVLRRELAALLVEQGGERLKTMAALPPTTRLWLADYFSSVDDERVVAWAESVLAEVPAPLREEKPVVFMAVERMARYYQRQGELERAAQTWLRMTKYFDEAVWHVPDATVEAARLYRSIGNKEKSNELYEQAVRIGEGWFLAVALWDRAERLIEEGKHKEVQQWLQRPITGSNNAMGKIVASSFLAYSFYRTKNFDKAQHYAQEAARVYDGLNDALAKEKNLDWIINMADNSLSWIDRWRKHRVICYPSTIRMVVNTKRGETKPFIQRVRVEAFPDALVTAICNNPSLKISIADVEESKDAFQYSVVKEIIIEVAADALHQNVYAVLAVSDARSGKQAEKVQVYVNLQNGQQ